MPWCINENAAHVDSLGFADSSLVKIAPVACVAVGTFSFEFNMIGKSRGPITPSMFDELRKFVEKLLGSHLSVHLRKYENAQKANCDIFVPHRLVYLYDRIRVSIESLKDENPTADVVAFIELSFFQTLVESFKSGQAWRSVAQELNEKGSFVHMITMLAFLKIQRIRGTTAKIIPAKNESAKSADAVLYTPLCDRVDVEIKSPELLWSPIELTEDQAGRVIKNAWKKAKGQIGVRSSVLVIGGIYVPKAALDRLEEAAKKFLKRKKNTQVAYIMILSVTALVDKPVLKDNSIGINSETSVMPQLAIRQVRNEYYDGIVKFYESDREVPGLTRHEGEIEEIRLGND